MRVSPGDSLRTGFDRLVTGRPRALLGFLAALFALFAVFHFPSRNQALERVRTESLRELEWQEIHQRTVGTSRLPVAEPRVLKEILREIEAGQLSRPRDRRLRLVVSRSAGAPEPERLRALLEAILETTSPLTFDTRGEGYSPTEAKVMLTALGEDGRDLYLESQIAFDMIFPIVYALLAIVALACLAPDPDPDSRLRRHLHWVVCAPVGMAVADLAENWLGLSLISRFDTGLPPALVGIASLATRIKFVFGGLTVVLVGALLLWKIGRDRATVIERLLALAGLLWLAMRIESLSARLLVASLAAFVLWKIWRDRAAVIASLFERLLPYAMLIRVQLIFALILLLLARLGSSSLPTIENLMIVESWGQMALMTLLCLQAGGVLGFTLLVTWDYADKRFGVQEVKLPGRLAEPGVRRTIWFAILGLPLIAQIAVSSSIPPNGRMEPSEILLGFGVGLLLAGALAGAIALGLRLLHRCLRWLVRRAPWVVGLLEPLGPGYVEEDSEHRKVILPAHVLATVGLGALAGLYLVGFFLLDPRREGFFIELHPTLAFVLVMFILLCFILAGASFFFDRYRIPILLATALYLALMATYFPRDHYFDVTLEPRSARPAPSTASLARWQHQGAPGPEGRIVTLVTLDGGGIQAAAWAAEVLTGLHAAFGDEFTHSIAFVSSVSGGSVGALYYLEALDGDTGLPRREALNAVRRAAAESSLEATAWGLAYPDFLRGFLPFADMLPGLDLEQRDRAWAMEQVWTRTVADMRAEIDPGPPPAHERAPVAARLSDWALRAAAGRMPGVVMNATIVEDGQQFWASNLELAELDRLPLSESRPPVADPSLSRHYGATWVGDGPPLPIADQWLDMAVPTGARLSATFPWVTPIARARLQPEVDSDGEVYEPQLPAHHVADGGYFDNFGAVAALSWLNRTVKADDIRHVLFIEVRSFAVGEPEQPATDRGWAFATLGPLQALLRVRTSSQAGRNDLEIELAQQVERWSDGAELRHVVIRPPQIEHRREPPLSWHLSRSDKRQICRDWLALLPQIREDFAGVFPSPSRHDWPTTAECDVRMD